jgi:hypothetical protein
MVDLYGPSIILQETMGLSTKVKKVLEGFLPGWAFEAVDVAGRSRGLAIGWLHRQIRCDNLWGIQLGIGADFFSREVNLSFSVLNLYGPYQSRLQFWEDLFRKSLCCNPDLIVGGDLNFSLGEAEI